MSKRSPTAAAPYLRSPTIAGDRIAFVADDDIWLGAVGSAEAWRLTSDRVPPSRLRLSPDGALLAYTAAVDGPVEAYVADLETGERRRLTYWGDEHAEVLGWSPDGRVVVASGRQGPFAMEKWAWAVPAAGGAAERLPFGPVSAVSWADDGDGGDGGGAVAVGVDQSRHRGAAWKRYRGGTAGKVWIDRDGRGHFTRFAPDLDGQIEDPQWCAGRLAFVSDHEGTGNIYSLAPDGGDLRRHTDHEGWYARAAVGDGHRVVYQCAGDIWLLEDLSPTSVPRRLDLRLGSARSGASPGPITVAADLGRVAPDHDGHGAALAVRGAIVWLTHRDGPARILAPGGADRGRLPVVLGAGDTVRVAWVGDGGQSDGLAGRDAIEVVSLSRTSPVTSQFLATGDIGTVLDLAASPDGRWLGLATNGGRILLVDAGTGATRQIDRSTDGEATGLAFSPDSRWLAWSHAGPSSPSDRALRQIRLAAVDPADGAAGEDATGGAPKAGAGAEIETGGETGAGAGGGGGMVEIIEATPLRFCDHDPVWTPDGHYLGFLSERSFDPVYDEYGFDLGFPAATRPYLLPLAAGTPAPWAPKMGGRVVGSGRHEQDARDIDIDIDIDIGIGGADAGAADGTVRVDVDVDGLADRVVGVPVAAGRLTGLMATPGALLWRSLPVTGTTGEARPDPAAPPARASLVRYDLTERRETTVVDALDDAWPTADGTVLVVRDGDALRVVPADHPLADAADPGRVDIDLTRVRLHTDPPGEWLQMYDEAARLMRDNFWVEDMAGVDWPTVVARYRSLVGRISTRDELSDIVWEVQGELGASHAYEMPPERTVEPSLRPAHLGADLEPDGDGRWIVRRLTPSESSVPAARSPLLDPGVGVVPGDAIVAVDGRPVDGRGPAPLLLGAGDRPVELRLVTGDGIERTAVVVPLTDERPLHYQAWVAGRRAMVRGATSGRVGYLHVPDMAPGGWAQLHRDLLVEVECEALVLDLRNNGGGHTSQLVLQKLGWEVSAWALIRNRSPRPYPFDARRGPLVTIINQGAGSDGDIAAAVIRQRGLGPLVGTRTWGGVIGIDPQQRLVDGTTVTQPQFAYWFDGPGWGVENHGVDPDIEVPFPPHDWGAGRDPQLDAAVGLALGALADRPASGPPGLADRPERRPPPLPPRPA